MLFPTIALSLVCNVPAPQARIGWMLTQRLLLRVDDLHRYLLGVVCAILMRGISNAQSVPAALQCAAHMLVLDEDVQRVRGWRGEGVGRCA